MNDTQSSFAEDAPGLTACVHRKPPAQSVPLPGGPVPGEGWAALLAELREHTGFYQDLTRAEMKLTQQIKSICRRLTGDFVGGKSDQAGAAARALYNAIAVTKDPAAHPLGLVAMGACLFLLEARKAVHRGRLAHKASIEKLTKRTPVWLWAEAIRGLGPLGLGELLGEIGDPSHYATVSKLWKRMCVGMVCIDGDWTRQRRTVNAEHARIHGFSPDRRSILWMVGDALIKKREGNPFREVYDVKKADYEANRPGWTKAHRHLAAKRYMEKRLLRELWRQWRVRTGALGPTQICSPVDECPDAPVRGPSARSPAPVALSTESSLLGSARSSLR